MEATPKPIILVGGGKGGVGKSMVTMALLDYLRATERVAMFVETDTSAPDVWKTYHNHLEGKCVDLDTQGGWIDLLDIAGEKPDCNIVINTRAANQVALRKFGGLLTEAIRQQQRQLLVLWVIDRKRDGLELLRDFLDSQPADELVTVHVVRNLHWGEEASFDTYNTSQIRKAVEERRGKSLNFPGVADRVAEDINKGRLPIHQALQELSFGSRIELARWQAASRGMFAEIVT